MHGASFIHTHATDGIFRHCLVPALCRQTGLALSAGIRAKMISRIPPETERVLRDGQGLKRGQVAVLGGADQIPISSGLSFAFF